MYGGPLLTSNTFRVLSLIARSLLISSFRLTLGINTNQAYITTDWYKVTSRAMITSDSWFA